MRVRAPAHTHAGHKRRIRNRTEKGEKAALARLRRRGQGATFARHRRMISSRFTSDEFMEHDLSPQRSCRTERVGGVQKSTAGEWTNSFQIRADFDDRFKIVD
jgi:hypothetical protein